MEADRPETLTQETPMLEDLQAPINALDKDIRDTWRRL